MHWFFQRRRCASLGPLTAVMVTALLALCAHAQTEPSEAQPPPTVPSTYTLSGVVLNSVTGEPVRRALVQIAGPPLNTATPLAVLSDSEGRFQFPDLQESDLVLVLRKPGFFSDQELHPENYQPSIVHLGRNTSALILKLAPEGIISGHVATVKGEPLEDTTVRALQQRVVEGRRRWEQRGQAATDEDGQFRFANLMPGQYLLVAGPSVGGARISSARPAVREEGFASVFYPGVPELESATPIPILPGQQVQADFSLKPEAVFRVSGTVVGLPPGMGNGPQFTSKAGEPVNGPVTFDVQTGKFEARVPAGSYLLLVRTPDATGNLMAAELPLSVTSDTLGVNLVLGQPLTLSIRVNTRPSGTVTAQDSTDRFRTASAGPPLPQVRLIPAETRLQAQEFQADFGDKQLGPAVHNLAPGRYSVDLLPNPPWYVYSATSGTTDILREDLWIAAGRRPESLDVTLRDDGANLTGSVRVEGQPAPGAVLVVPDQQSLAHARFAIAGFGGEFQFDRLAPGDYKLLAFDTVEGVEFRNPEALAPYLSKATHITLQPNEQTTILLERISAGK